MISSEGEQWGRDEIYQHSWSNSRPAITGVPAGHQLHGKVRLRNEDLNGKIWEDHPQKKMGNGPAIHKNKWDLNIQFFTGSSMFFFLGHVHNKWLDIFRPAPAGRLTLLMSSISSLALCNLGKASASRSECQMQALSQPPEKHLYSNPYIRIQKTEKNL